MRKPVLVSVALFGLIGGASALLWSADRPVASVTEPEVRAEAGLSGIDEPALTLLDDGTSLSLDLADPIPVTGGVQLDAVFELGTLEALGRTTFFAIDVSGSTNEKRNIGCSDNFNSDRWNDSIMDCELTAVWDVMPLLGEHDQVGALVFSDQAAFMDVQPASGRQLFTAPMADLDGDGMADMEYVLRSVTQTGAFQYSRAYAGGWTRFDNASRRMCEALSQATTAQRRAVFLSDGYAGRGSGVTDILPCPGLDVAFTTVAIGPGASCSFSTAPGRSLQDIADLTGGTCIETSDFSVVRELLIEQLFGEVTRLTLSIDDGPPEDITTSSIDVLPHRGGGQLSLSHVVAGEGDHTYCVTVYATDNNGVESSVTDCVGQVENEAPLADAGEDLLITEGALATFDGSLSSDPDGDPLSYVWTLSAQSGPPLVLPTAILPTATVQTLDDGVYTLSLTVSDGELTSTDEVVLTVENAAPMVSAQVDGAPANGVVLLTGSFTDLGLLDTHAVDVDWGDGTLDAVPVSAQGSGWGSFFASHAYDGAGSYAITAMLTDDDGGVSTVALTQVEIGQALAVWATDEDGDGLKWNGSNSAIAGWVHSNADLDLSGSENTISGTLTYAGSESVGGDVDVASGPDEAAVAAPPVTYDIADYRPGGRAAVQAGTAYFDMSSECNGDYWTPKSSLASGLYYASCGVELDTSYLSGEATFAAEGQIKLNGSDHNFQPFVDGLLFLSMATDDPGIELSGSNSIFLGFIQAEGQIKAPGSDNRFLCGVIGGSLELSGSGLDIVASDCVRPDRTVAPTTLVPRLALSLDNALDDALPGEADPSALTLSNTGAVLLVPGVVGLENLGLVDVTLTSGSATLETFDPSTSTWSALAAPVTLTARPNLNPETTYADPSAADPFAGTVMQPGALTTWGVELQLDLDPATVAFLLDANQVGAVRTVVAFTQDDPAVPVRRLYRFGDDFVDQLRAHGGDVQDVAVTATTVDGAVHLLDGTTHTALATITSGQVVQLTLPATTLVPAAKSGSESNEAYLGRLHALDGAPLGATAWAQGVGGVGIVLAGQVVDTTTLHLPVLDPNVQAPARVLAGETADIAISLANQSSEQAGTIEAHVVFEAAETPYAGIPTTLLSGQSASDSMNLAVDAVYGGSAVRPRAVLAWQDTLGHSYGPLLYPVEIRVDVPGDLVAVLSDNLHEDGDLNSIFSAGDVVRYVASFANSGSVALTDVNVSLPLDPNSTLVPGSVLTSQGSVTSTGGTLAVALGDVAGMGAATIQFDVQISDPLPTGIDRLSVQGSATDASGTVTLTDDPAVVGAEDATETHILFAEPNLYAALVDTLELDVDLNGAPTQGDTLRYSAELFNLGLAAANDVRFELPIDSGTVLVPGSLDTLGIVLEGNTVGDTRVVVDFGQVTQYAVPRVQFDVTITTDVPSATLSAQATIDSVELATLFSDDPDTATVNDATLTQIGVTSGGGTVYEDEGDELGFGPSVTIDFPIDGDRLGVPASIQTTALAVDTPLSSWKLVAWSALGTLDDAVVLGEGTGDMPGVSGLFDPTLLENGLYRLRAEVTDEGGYVGRDTSSVVVDGDMKLGSYDVAFMDADWQSSIFSASMLRSYSTTRKDTVGDFGKGWRLSMTDVQVMTNGPLGQSGWIQEQCGGGMLFVPICTTSDNPHLVVVKWPGGRIEAFDLTPDEGNSFFSSLAAIAYTARAGTSSTLSPLSGDSAATLLGDGNLYSGFGATLYNPQQFLLTDTVGTTYLLDRTEGLLETTDRNGNTVRYTHDGIFPDKGVGVTFTRDSLDRIVTMDLPRGDIDYVYDASGDLVEVIDQEEAVVEFVYDGEHRLVSYNDQGHPAVAFVEYDSEGRVIRREDGTGVFVAQSVDTLAWTSTVVGPDPRLTTTTQFNANGQVQSVSQSAEGTVRETSLVYTDYRVTQVTGVGGEITTFAYDDNGRVTSTVGPDGIASSVEYNTFGGVTASYVNGRLTGSTVFDANGNPTEDHGPNGELLKTTTYHDWGAPEQYEDADEVGSTIFYDALGQVHGLELNFHEPELAGARYHQQAASVQRPPVYYTLGPDGELIGVENGSDVPLIGINERGQMVSYTDENYHTQSWVYAANGNLEAVVDKLGGRNEFEYNRVNLILKETTRLGEEIHFTYNDKGQLTRVQGPDAFVAYTYDAFGQVLTVENESALIELGWDERGFVDTVTSSGTAFDGMSPVTLGYTYAQSGRFEQLTTPFGTVGLTYDSEGAPASVVDSNTGTYSYTWREDGLLNTVTGPTGMQTAYGYTDGNRLNLIEATDQSGTSLQALEMTYDPYGKLATKTDATGTHSFFYDENGRLEYADHPDASQVPDELYAYDTLGNRTEWANHPAPEVEHDDGDRLIADAEFTYGFDAEGRLVAQTHKASGGTTTYRWNSFDELLAVEYPDGSETSFLYDGLGRRIEVNDRGEVSRFVWDGMAPLITLDGDDNLVLWQTTDPWGDLLAEWTASGVKDLLHDHMWSRVGWLEDGAVTWDPRDSFGNAVYADGGVHSQALTWHSQDPTGLMYMYARYMDPRTGRFISEDPVSSGDLYSYAMNDPMNRWDPFGASAVEYGTINSNTSRPTQGGATTIGCKVRCMLETTAEGVAMAALAGQVDGLEITMDLATCAATGSGKPGQCFPAGTSIQTSVGEEAIQRVDVGDRVLAMEDEGNGWVRVSETDGVLENEEVPDVH